MNTKTERWVLAVGAHPDDVEFGCGGTLLALRNRGFRVRTVVLTRGEAASNGYDRVKEAERALRGLGVDQVIVHDFPDTQLFSQLDRVVQAIEHHLSTCEPAIVLTHSQHDHHQDHRAVFTATMAASRHKETILSYETPFSPPEFCPEAFFDITPYIEQKLSAIREHNSQNGKWYLGKEHILHRAYVRGLQARLRSSPTAAAEAFEVVRMRLSDWIGVGEEA